MSLRHLRVGSRVRVLRGDATWVKGVVRVIIRKTPPERDRVDVELDGGGMVRVVVHPVGLELV